MCGHIVEGMLEKMQKHRRCLDPRSPTFGLEAHLTLNPFVGGRTAYCPGVLAVAGLGRNNCVACLCFESLCWVSFPDFKLSKGRGFIEALKRSAAECFAITERGSSRGSSS
jgi:hypothetical protein